MRRAGAVVVGVLLLGLAVAWAAGPCTPLGTVTPILGLCKPQSGEIGWDAALNGNFETLDGLFTGAQLLRQAHGGTGLNTAGAGPGQLLIGTGSGLSLGTLTAGSGILLTPGAGTVTIATSGAPGGGSLVAAGTLAGTGTGDYSTTAGSFVDVDATHLKASVTIPGAAKFLLVQATFAVGHLGPSISDGLAHVQFLAAGSSVGQGVFVNSTVLSPAGVYTLYGVVTNPTPGLQTIALQFRGDGTNPFVILNPAVEGAGPTVRPRMQWQVTN